MSIPEQHSVYRLTKDRSVDKLEKVSEKTPQPAADEVLVKVHSVAVNSRDIQVIDGRYPAPVAESVCPCSDMAGEVVAIGDKVTAVSNGDSVVSNFKGRDVWAPAGGLEYSLGGAEDGCLREYVLLHQDAVNKIKRPDGFSWHEAASLVCTGVTVWNSLYGLKRLSAGEVVLCLGTGGVALTALSIAQKAGAVTIITSSSDEKLKLVKEKYGADYTINYKTNEDWDKKVMEITNGKGANHVIETGGNGTIAKSINSVAPDGVISLVGYMADLTGDGTAQLPEVFINSLVHSAILRGIKVGSKHHAQELIRFVENKGLHLAIDKVYSYHKGESIDALKALYTGNHVGKICISFD